MLYRIVANDTTDIYGSTRDKVLLDPVLDLEANAAGSLDFTMPVENSFYNDIRLMATLLYVYEQEELVWVGRVVSVELDWKKRKKIHCEGALAFLNDTVQRPKEVGAFVTEITTREGAVSVPPGYEDYSSRGDLITDGYQIQTATYHNKTVKITSKITKTSDDSIDPPQYSTEYSTGTMVGQVTNRDFFKTLLYDHNAHCGRGFEPGTITVAIEQNVYRKVEWETTWDAMKSCCLDPCGGYLVPRYVKDETSGNVTMYLDWLSDLPNTGNQPAQFALNLLDLIQTIDISNFATQVIPLGATDDTGKKITVERADQWHNPPWNVPVGVLGPDFIRYNRNGEDDPDDPVNTYGNIERAVDFSDIESPNELFTAGWNWLVSEILWSNGKAISVTAADLSPLTSRYTPFRIGQLVRIYSEPHGVDMKLPITQIEISMTTAVKKITLGFPEHTELSSISRAEVMKEKEEKDRDIQTSLDNKVNVNTAYKTTGMDSMSGLFVVESPEEEEES
jgi:hypothetical protein